ncbi:MAG: immunoglobulin domain-containing protein, partial [Bacteroidota bacterium]|nr:immunoglobulin domain-containing protein [Bacteroidota bacterium]
IEDVQASDLGSDYWVEVIGVCGRAEQRGYTIVSPTVAIVRQPQGGSFCAGSAVVLEVEAQIGGGGQRVEYQWRRNGQPLADGGNVSGTRTAQLRIDPAGTANGGTYDVVVTVYPGGVQATSSGAQVEVVQPAQIVRQPQGGQFCGGRPLSLEVQATGGGLTYQWTKDGQPLTGATSARYEVTAATEGNSGRYVCVIRNACGEIRTEEVEVDVVSLPRIVQDVPAVVQVQLGQPLVLEIQASGDELQYQWYKDWQPIAGATSPRYEKSAAEQGDVGTYWCVVQNRCDSAWSRQAQVQVVVSVAEAKERAVLEVVPQPVLGGVMEIRYVVEGEGVIVVRDVAGREVERRLVMGTGRTVVAVSGSGTYTVQIEQAGRVIGQRVVVVVR